MLPKRSTLIRNQQIRTPALRPLVSEPKYQPRLCQSMFND
jgi:hypothetical protein